LPRGIACLIEKPLAASSTEAASIARLAAEHSTLCQVGHTERFNPAVRAVVEMDLRPRFIEIDRVAPMSFRSVDVGVVFDLMIHDLDIVLMMTRAPLVDVRAVGVGVLTEHEDVANARLLFADGCVANLTCSRLALKTERKLRVFSESAYLTLDFAKRSGMLVSTNDHQEVLQRVRERLSRGEDLSGLDYMGLVQMHPLQIPEEDALQAELTHFLHCVRSGEAPRVDAEAGRAAVDAAEQVVNALRAHHWDGIEGTTLG
jgi:predicted dehydrogenase